MPAPRNQAEANAQALLESKINVEQIDREDALDELRDDFEGLDVDGFFDTLRPENFEDPYYTIEAWPRVYDNAEGPVNDLQAQVEAVSLGGKYPDERGPADDVEAQMLAYGVDTVGEVINEHNRVDIKPQEQLHINEDPLVPSLSAQESNEDGELLSEVEVSDEDIRKVMEVHEHKNVGLPLAVTDEGNVADDIEDEQLDEEYDPSQHTAEEVQSFIDAHPDREDDVLAAERDGKARKTLVG